MLLGALMYDHGFGFIQIIPAFHLSLDWLFVVYDADENPSIEITHFDAANLTWLLCASAK